MKVKIIFIILVFVTAAITAVTTTIITSRAKDSQFERVEKVYIRTYDKLFEAHEKLASQARYMISQTLTVKKNKNLQIIYVPTSTMTIDSLIRATNREIRAPIDSLHSQ